MKNFLTIDVEDYFQVEAFSGTISSRDWDNFPSRADRNTRRILEILANRGVRGTFFVLGWIAERHPELVREIADHGHEIASHGQTHEPLNRLTKAAFREELRRSRRTLEDLVGLPVLGFRAPTFSITEKTSWAFEILEEEGFRYDSSVFPIRHDNYGWPSFSRNPVAVHGKLLEIPMSTVRIGHVNLPFSGGGYLRMLPYPALAKTIARTNRQEGVPVVVYLHPWELDPDQPRIPAGVMSRFRHYQNLSTTQGKLEKLIRDFEFSPIADAYPEFREAR